MATTHRRIGGVIAALLCAGLIGYAQLNDVPDVELTFAWQGPVYEPPCCKDVCEGIWGCLTCYNAMLLTTSWCVR